MCGRRGPQAGSLAGLWGHQPGCRIGSQKAQRGSQVPPFLPQKSHRRAGKSMDCRARGPLLQFLPHHLLSCDLGRSPTSVSLPCLIPNREQCSCNAQVPATPSQFFLTQSYWARPSSLICANGEVLSPVFHHSSQRIFSF